MRASLLAILLSALGCSSSASQDAPEAPEPAPASDLLAPPPEGEGIQLAFETTIAAGAELERCRYFRMPDETLHVGKKQVRYTEGSHHVLLLETNRTELPEGASDDGTFDCVGGGFGSGEVTRIVAGSQGPKGPAEEYPEGVALTLAPGSIVIANVHYLNTTTEPLVADVRINLWTVPPETVVHEVGSLFWYDWYVSVPARSTSQTRMACNVAEPIHLLSIGSHMHARGVAFDAFVAGSDPTSEPLLEIDSWENVPPRPFAPPREIAGGTTIEFGCTYDNPEDRHVVQGLTTEDEMCVMTGSYYPRDPLMELCALSPFGLFRAATWIGTGAATCEETLSCISGAQGGDGGTAECIRQSCPGAASAVSDLVRCIEGSSDPLFQCGPAYRACQEAAC